MKKLTLILVCLLVTVTMYAQPAGTKVTWGTVEKTLILACEVLTSDETGYYAKVKSVDGMALTDELMKLDKDFKQQSYYAFENKNEKTKLHQYFTGYYIVAGKAYCMYYVADDKAKKSRFEVITLDRNTMKPIGEPKVIMDFPFEKKNNSGDFYCYQSSDKTKFLVIGEKPQQDNEDENFFMKVMDADLNTLWDKEVKWKYNVDLFVHEDWKIDNDGNTYLLGKLYKDENKKGEQNFSYRIISFRDKGAQKSDFEIKIKNGQFVKSVSFATGKNNEIVVGGFYAKPEQSRRSIDGCYYMRMNTVNEEVLVSTIKEFDVEFVVKGMSPNAAERARKRAAEGKDLDIKNIKMRPLVMKEDGGCIIIGEETEINLDISLSNMVAKSSGVAASRGSFYYGDIISVNIAPDGKVLWASKLPKVQSTQDDNGNYSSFAAAAVKDKVYFFYNDHVKNTIDKTYDEIYRMQLNRNGAFVMVTLDNSGKLKREEIINLDVAETAIVSQSCKQIEPNKIFIYGNWMKKQQFSTIEITN
ncbi:MAG: hypothetical protein IPO27_11025 [Bacteroidetes bacterium]|nr:hypothetical protein [Bacteroidota bacterium]